MGQTLTLIVDFEVTHMTENQDEGSYVCKNYTGTKGSFDSCMYEETSKRQMENYGCVNALLKVKEYPSCDLSRFNTR